MSRQSRHWLVLLGVAVATVVADRISKTIISNRLALYESWHPPAPFVKIFSLTYTTNSGAAFGIFPDLQFLLIIVALIVIVAIIFYYRQLPAEYWLARLALGLQLGGALGNWIDRVRQGYVVDFVDLNFWPVHNWPVFNIADSAIVVGVSLLAFTMLREDIWDQDQSSGHSENDASGKAETPGNQTVAPASQAGASTGDSGTSP